MSSSLRMLEYYCEHKSLQDTIIAFYHTAKQYSNTNPSSLHLLQSRFNSYFSQIDLNSLDREQREIVKATSLILENNKNIPGGQKTMDSVEVESTVLTPKESLRLMINSSRYQDLTPGNGSRYADGVGNGWNPQPNQQRSSDVRMMKVQNSGSDTFSQKGRQSMHREVTSVDSLYSKLLEEHKSHKIDLAYQTSKAIQKVMQSESQSNPEITNKIKSIQAEYSQMTDYYKEFDKPGWKFDNTTNNISLYSKTINDGQHVAVLITAQLDIPLLHFLVMTQEIDLFHKFVPFCGEGEEIKRLHRNLYVGRSTVDIPLLTNRETYFYAKMIDRITTTGSIFFYSKSINTPETCKQFGVTLPEQSKYVKLEYNFFLVQCKILSRQKIHVRMASSVDMKLNFLPNFILMMSARKFALQYFMNILKQQKRFSESEWFKRIKSRELIYGYFQEIVDQYLVSS